MIIEVKVYLNANRDTVVEVSEKGSKPLVTTLKGDYLNHYSDHIYRREVSRLIDLLIEGKKYKKPEGKSVY